MRPLQIFLIALCRGGIGRSSERSLRYGDSHGGGAHLSDHIKDDGDVRNIPLTEEQVLNIPEYINHYDDILNVTTKKDGSTRIVLGKKINGHAVIVELVSKGRQSIQPVTAWQNATDQYVQKYAKKGAYTTSQTAIKAADSGYTHAPISTITQPSHNVNRSHIYQAGNSDTGGKEAGLPAVQDLSSETLREWLQAAGHTGDSLSALQNLYIQTGMAVEKASRTVLQNLLNRYAGAFRNGTDGVTAQAIAEAAEKDRLERTVAGENARYNGTAEALVEAALQLPRDTEARNLADQATIARQAEILGKLEELEAAKKQAGGIQTSEQLQTFMKTVGRLEQELEALEQGKLSDRLDSETLGRLAEAVQTGQRNQIADTIAPQTAGTEQQKLQLATAWENGKLTAGGIDGKVDLERNMQSDNLNQLSSVLRNGYADAEIISRNASVFENQSETELVEYLNSVGYLTHTQGSKYSQSRARIIKIQNTGGDLNISQVQISPGGGRHGINPYIKISTTTQGVIKIIFGDPNTYKTDGKETAILIFAGGTRND